MYTMKGKKVELIRSANKGDGEGFDPAKKQALIRNADGKKQIVPWSDLTEEKDPVEKKPSK